MTRRSPVTEKSRYRRTKAASPQRKGETYADVLDRLCPQVFGTPQGAELLAALFDHHALTAWNVDESESALRGQRAVVNLLIQLEQHTVGRAGADARTERQRNRDGPESGDG